MALVTPEIERLSEKNRERGRLRIFAEKSAVDGDNGKSARIERNNLGKKKYNAQKAKARERVENYINAAENIEKAALGMN